MQSRSEFGEVEETWGQKDKETWGLGDLGDNENNSFSTSPPLPLSPSPPSPQPHFVGTHVPPISALGLDVGSKRIGVAGCDRTGLIASGIDTIERKYLQKDIEKIQQLVNEREVNVLVVGLPYSMDGSLGFQARQIQKFAKRLSKALKLPVEYVDERLTSFQAEQMLIAQNRSPSRNKGLIDRLAACLILQQWLDVRRSHLTRQ
ncbi:Holliday junction resolvase YqgF [Tolypothrix sp. NIES-4075]|nr:Holliday junction resolvase YqgF [Tolypothrix sp. NIES-4075]